MILLWAGIWASLSSAELPEIHVGFPPFILKPVTEYSTVYTSMLSFVKVTNQLDQEVLNLFCDEGVFMIVLDIDLRKKDGFCNIIWLHLEVYPRIWHRGQPQTQVFGVNVADAVLNRKNYVCSLKGYWC